MYKVIGMKVTQILILLYSINQQFQVVIRLLIGLHLVGTIHVSNLPAIAITNTQTASNESTHLALTAQQGDIVIRSDELKTYVHNGGTAGTMADYTVLATPTDTVTSVSGRTGAITLTSSDVGLGNVENIELSTWNGSNNITTVGEITNGTWSANTIAVNKGGTGQTSFIDNQLLIGKTTGNTLEKVTLTAGNNITITNSSGTLTIESQNTTYNAATTQ